MFGFSETASSDLGRSKTSCGATSNRQRYALALGTSAGTRFDILIPPYCAV
jgi:hypothetical protein